MAALSLFLKFIVANTWKSDLKPFDLDSFISHIMQ